MTPDAAPLTFDQERQAVLDSMNLPLLFLGAARVDVARPTADAATRTATGPRLLQADVTPDRPLTASGTAALLSTAFHDPRVSSIVLDRTDDGVLARCTYVLPFGAWQISLRAGIAAAGLARPPSTPCAPR